VFDLALLRVWTAALNFSRQVASGNFQGLLIGLLSIAILKTFDKAGEKQKKMKIDSDVSL